MGSPASAIRNIAIFDSEFFFHEDAYYTVSNVFPGETLAKYLTSHLANTGYSVTQPKLTDIAWNFECDRDEHRFRIYINGDGGFTSRGWALVVTRRLNILKQIFRRSDLSAFRKLCNDVHTVLSTDIYESIENIKWYTDEEWERGVRIE